MRPIAVGVTVSWRGYRNAMLPRHSLYSDPTQQTCLWISGRCKCICNACFSRQIQCLSLKLSATQGGGPVLHLSRLHQSVHASAGHSAARRTVDRQIQYLYRQIGGGPIPTLAYTSQTKASSTGLCYGFKGSPYGRTQSLIPVRSQPSCV